MNEEYTAHGSHRQEGRRYGDGDESPGESKQVCRASDQSGGTASCRAISAFARRGTQRRRRGRAGQEASEGDASRSGEEGRRRSSRENAGGSAQREDASSPRERIAQERSGAPASSAAGGWRRQRHQSDFNEDTKRRSITPAFTGMSLANMEYLEDRAVRPPTRTPADAASPGALPANRRRWPLHVEQASQPMVVRTAC
jgi:hypothetical protein